MTISNATPEQKKRILHAAVQARLAYWAAMDAVESLYVSNGSVTDSQSDKLHDLVVSLAEGYPGSLARPNPAAIEPGHVEALDAIYA